MKEMNKTKNILVEVVVEWKVNWIKFRWFGGSVKNRTKCYGVLS